MNWPSGTVPWTRRRSVISPRDSGCPQIQPSPISPSAAASSRAPVPFPTSPSMARPVSTISRQPMSRTARPAMSRDRPTGSAAMALRRKTSCSKFPRFSSAIRTTRSSMTAARRPSASSLPMKWTPPAVPLIPRPFSRGRSRPARWRPPCPHRRPFPPISSRQPMA